jgi:NADH:ubiquinone oxidoreductase subunit F (NADH-binding)
MSLPRLLAGARRDRPLSLDEHEHVHGPMPRRGPDLIEWIDEAGLRGRGGAGFPTAVKMRTVARSRGPRALLVNAAESEPMSAKDRALMQMAPQLVIDGALAAADAVGARTVVIALPNDPSYPRVALEDALRQRSAGRRVKLVSVPWAHLAGEESALINYLNGGPLKPTLVPPLPAERGLRRRPTLVQNPETLAHLALIARHGPAWFRSLGPDLHPGSALVTVSGAVSEHGVREIACGAPLSAVLDSAGGALEPIRAVLIGGYHGVWVAGEDIDSTTLDDPCLARHGGSLGAGVIVALGRSACPLQELAGTIAWLASENAGQCGPCVHGLPALAELLSLVAAGQAPRDVSQRLDRYSRNLVRRGACHLPDGAVRFLGSGLNVFAPEIAQHDLRGRCPACLRPPTLRFGVPGRTRRRVAA